MQHFETKADFARRMGWNRSSVTRFAVAGEMNNTAGKIINAQKVQLEYAALKKVAPSIAFLDTAETK